MRGEGKTKVGGGGRGGFLGRSLALGSRLSAVAQRGLVVASYAGPESRKIGLARCRRGLLRTSTFALGVTAAAWAATGPAAAAGPLVPSAGKPSTGVVVPSFPAPQPPGAGRSPSPAASPKSA